MHNSNCPSVDELIHLDQSLYEDADREYIEGVDFSPDDELYFSDDDSDDELDEFEVHITQTEISTDVINLLNYVVPEKREKRELSNLERAHIAQTLIILHAGRKHRCGKSVPNGAIGALADQYKVNRSTIGRIWKSAKTHLANGTLINVKNKKKGNVGRKAKGFDLETLLAIPIEKMTTIRALATALGMSNGIVYRLLKSGQLRAHTNSIKPSLKDHHKRHRLQHILAYVIPGTIRTITRFSAMYNIVHIDEKWFYMSQETQRFYLFPWEEDPYRACQNKRFIGKVMFLAAIARPILGENGEVLWDGKIGIWPFTEDVAAQRSSKNRERGTIETKGMQSITQSSIRQKLIENFLPTLREKWPENAVKDIWVQQDNARPHIATNDLEFIEAATKDGFNIRLINQPAQSPDLNVLDLGFFRAIQSIQYKAFPKSVDELVKAVDDAYNSFEPSEINYTWLQMQYCMLEVMEVEGGNNYKNPHHGKKKLERLGQLPKQIDIPNNLLRKTQAYLNEGYVNINVPLTGGEH